jgi:hypothetical protein
MPFRTFGTPLWGPWTCSSQRERPRRGSPCPSVSRPGVVQGALETEGSRAMFDGGSFGAFAKTYYPESWIRAVYALFHDHTDQITAKRKLNMIVADFTRKRFRGAVYARAQNVRGAFRDAFDRVLTDVDVLIMPTCLDVAPRYVEPRWELDEVAPAVSRRGVAPMGTFRRTLVGRDRLSEPTERNPRPAWSKDGPTWRSAPEPATRRPRWPWRRSCATISSRSTNGISRPRSGVSSTTSTRVPPTCGFRFATAK